MHHLLRSPHHCLRQQHAGRPRLAQAGTRRLPATVPLRRRAAPAREAHTTSLYSLMQCRCTTMPPPRTHWLLTTSRTRPARWHKCRGTARAPRAATVCTTPRVRCTLTQHAQQCTRHPRAAAGAALRAGRECTSARIAHEPHDTLLSACHAKLVRSCACPSARVHLHADAPLVAAAAPLPARSSTRAAASRRPTRADCLQLCISSVVQLPRARHTLLAFTH